MQGITQHCVIMVAVLVLMHSDKTSCRWWHVGKPPTDRDPESFGSGLTPWGLRTADWMAIGMQSAIEKWLQLLMPTRAIHNVEGRRPLISIL